MGVNGQRTLAHDRLDDGTRHTAVDEGARQAVAAANPGQFVGAPIRMGSQQWRAGNHPSTNGCCQRRTATIVGNGGNHPISQINSSPWPLPSSSCMFSQIRACRVINDSMV